MRCNALIPELYSSDIARTLDFYTRVAGFTVRYARPEERFAFLERGDAQLMVEQPTDPCRTWRTGAMEHPFGRGINFQIAVTDVAALYARCMEAGARIFLPLEERWYRTGDMQAGNRQFVVQDPDGYLLRFFENIGTRRHA